ncbi:MAG: hydrogen gas-evolving membrane-bound hydrogenase subunit E [Thiotrichaceae bacterium]
MNLRQLTSLIFLIGLGLLLAGVIKNLPLDTGQVGATILKIAPTEIGTANIVTSIVLAYRGLDTLGELTILFVAATAAGMVLGRGRIDSSHKAGFILRTASLILFPFLIVTGSYIIIHGHLTPGGGFQGGAILAVAFFLPVLASVGDSLDHHTSSVIEGFAGITFIVIGLLALWNHSYFLAPLFGTGNLGELLSAGSLPLLYMAVGLKVGAELASLLVSLAES